MKGVINELTCNHMVCDYRFLTKHIRCFLQSLQSKCWAFQYCIVVRRYMAGVAIARLAEVAFKNNTQMSRMHKRLTVNGVPKKKLGKGN